MLYILNEIQRQRSALALVHQRSTRLPVTHRRPAPARPPDRVLSSTRNQPTRARPRPVPRPPRPPLPLRLMGAATCSTSSLLVCSAAARIAPNACALCVAFGTTISNVAMALAAVAVLSMAPPSRLALPLMIVWRHVGHSLSCARHRSQQIAWPHPRRISRGASRQMRHSASG
jgi:hypothetical protein